MAGDQGQALSVYSENAAFLQQLGLMPTREVLTTG